MKGRTTGEKKIKEERKDKEKKDGDKGENRLQLQPGPFGEVISNYSYSRASAGELILDYSYRRALSRNFKCNNWCATGKRGVRLGVKGRDLKDELCARDHGQKY